MISNKRLITTTLCMFLLVCSLFSLSSCGVNHTHNYSNEWSKDGTYHWQACSGCNEIRNKTEHDWNSGIITLQPTETSEGVRTYTCNTCGQTKVESVPVLDSHEHTFSQDWMWDETHHWHAATCEHTSEKKEYEEHAWDSGVVTTAPTITSKGVKTYTCETCGKTKNEEIPELEEGHIHNYNQKNTNSQYIKSEATCTEKAVYYYSCSCGLSGTDTFEYGEATGHTYSTAWSYNDTHHWHSAICDHITEQKDYAEHDWDGGIVTTAPTTTSKGVKTYTCEICYKTRTEEIPELEEEHTHNYNQQTVNSDYLKSEATCTEKAVYYYSCSCGLKGTETFEYGNKLNHKFTNYVSNHDATCTNDGTKTAICDMCGIQEDTIVDIGSAMGHSYSNEWSVDETYHWHVAICEHTNEYTNKETHRWDSGTITKEPTETTEGEKTYTCEVCNKTKVVNIGILDHVHTYATEYTFDENYHWYAATCEHSSEVKSKEAHNWDSGIVESEATIYDKGIKLYTCQDCGNTKEEIIPKIPSFTVIFYDADNKAISNKNYSLATPSYQVTIPSVQSETGTQFDKWVDATTGKSITEINFETAEANVVYHFKPSFVKVFEVIFMDYEGKQLGETLLILEGQTISDSDLPQIPARTGYTSKWNKNSIVGSPIIENKVYVPVYEVITFTVTFLDAKGGNELAKRTVDYGSFAIIPEYKQYKLTTKLFGFTGWKSSATDLLIDNVDGNKIVNVYSDLTLYAVYEENIEEPIIAVHIEGTTVTVSLCLPDNTTLYSINLSMAWETETGISTINSISIANPTYLDGQYCSNQNASVHMEQSKWFTYNNKTQTFDFVWGCGSGHSFNVDLNTITINFGVQGFAEINEESFSILDGSTIVYGENGASIDALKKSSIKIWFY